MGTALREFLASEFVRGTALGIFLTAAGAVAANHLSNRQRKISAALLFGDLIRSVSDLIENLESSRDGNEAVELELLDTIESEITVYNRNREIPVLLKDTKLRRDIRDYFSRVAGLLSRQQASFRKFREETERSRHGKDPRHDPRPRRPRSITLRKRINCVWSWAILGAETLTLVAAWHRPDDLCLGAHH